MNFDNEKLFKKSEQLGCEKRFRKNPLEALKSNNEIQKSNPKKKKFYERCAAIYGQLGLNIRHAYYRGKIAGVSPTSKNYTLWGDAARRARLSNYKELYEKGIQLDPKSSDLYYRKGLDEIYNENRATDYFRKAISLNPNHLGANEELARIESRKYDRQPFTLIQIWTKIINLDPNNGYAYYQRGCAYKTLADFYQNQDYLLKSFDDLGEASLKGYSENDC